MHEVSRIVKVDFRRQKLFYAICFILGVIIADEIIGFDGVVSNFLEAIFLILSIILLFLYWKGKPRDAFLRQEGERVRVSWPTLLKVRSISFERDQVTKVVEYSSGYLAKFDIVLNTGEIIRICPERMLGLSFVRKVINQVSNFMNDLFGDRYERR